MDVLKYAMFYYYLFKTQSSVVAIAQWRMSFQIGVQHVILAISI